MPLPVMSPKIAIVGTCQTSRMLAPWQDGAWLKWVCSPGNRDVPCADAWFELHALADVGAESDRDWRAWLNQQKFTIYMQDVNPLVPAAKPFPIEEVIAGFRPFTPDFLTSTIAYMLGYAILQKPAEIGIYGVDMTHDSEYAYQRPGCRYFINEARRRGITVTIPPQSDLDRPTPMYGYASASPHARKFMARRAELEAMRVKFVNTLAEVDLMRQKMEKDLAKIEGAQENQRWIEHTYA